MRYLQCHETIMSVECNDKYIFVKTSTKLYRYKIEDFINNTHNNNIYKCITEIKSYVSYNEIHIYNDLLIYDVNNTFKTDFTDVVFITKYYLFKYNYPYIEKSNYLKIIKKYKIKGFMRDVKFYVKNNDIYCYDKHELLLLN